MRRIFALICLTLSFAPTSRGATNEYQFSGPEIFPIDYQLHQLKAADVNSDGLLDLVVVNNVRSKINILFNRTGRTNFVAPESSMEINSLPPDARFSIDSIASEKRISSMVIGDFNSDGKPDLAFYGEPKELVVQINLGTNGWEAPKKWSIEDGQLTPIALATGDLNGDKMLDLLLLAENHIYYFAQTTNHTFAEPQKIYFSGLVRAIHVADIDGDSLEDLLLVNWDTPTPFRFRLQNALGQLNPEVYLNIPPVRSFWLDDLDHNKIPELITIAQNSGRAQISHIIQKEGEKISGPVSEGQLLVLPLQRTSKARRATEWRDLNGDGRQDLLVVDPDGGLLNYFQQSPNGEFERATSFPTLSGITEISVFDWDKDSKPEIFLLSGEESQVGVTHLGTNGNIAFPRAIQIPGKPLVMSGGLIGAGQPPMLAVITEHEGKRLLVTISSDGGVEKIQTQKLAESFKGNPSSISVLDADQDGLMDLAILIPYEKIKFLLQKKDGTYSEIDVVPPGGTLDQPWLSKADVDEDGKPEILLAQKNFLRAVYLKEEVKNPFNTNSHNWAFVVKEQIQGPFSNSRIVGASTIQGDSNRLDFLLMLDAERKILSINERGTGGTWRAAKNIPLAYSDFTGLTTLQRSGKTPPTVCFTGLNAVGWMNFHGKVWDLKELDGYETPIKDGRLTDVISGNLNSEPTKDLIFLETSKNYLDIVAFKDGKNLVPGARWQVFEERSFRSRRNDGAEPREGLVEDVTGDGKRDLIILVHDRILVYPQE